MLLWVGVAHRERWCSRKSGRTIYRAPVRGGFRERFGASHCSFYRADLLAILAAPLPSGIVHLDARVSGVASGGPQTLSRTPSQARAAARVADGPEIEADIAAV